MMLKIFLLFQIIFVAVESKIYFKEQFGMLQLIVFFISSFISFSVFFLNFINFKFAKAIFFLVKQF